MISKSCKFSAFHLEFQKFFSITRTVLVTKYLLISGGSNGDLGGALVFREFSDDPWYQVGILSSFTGKFDEKKPGVYTKVEPFLPWIESKLEP